MSTPAFPPEVRFLQPPDGSLHLLGENITLSAEAIQPNGGTVGHVEYRTEDGSLLGSAALPPYQITWTNPPAGDWAITATAISSSGSGGTRTITVQVLSNLPSVVLMTSPPGQSVFMENDSFTLSADASDHGGSIQRVDFYRKGHLRFNEPDDFLGTRTNAPYSITVSNFPPEHYFVWAVATDSQGVASLAVPVMIEVMPLQPVIQIVPGTGFVALDWLPEQAALQMAPSPAGPWQIVSNATPPFTLPSTNRAAFFRARMQ
jgi:hypothetical protein